MENSFFFLHPSHSLLYKFLCRNILQNNKWEVEGVSSQIPPSITNMRQLYTLCICNLGRYSLFIWATTMHSSAHAPITQPSPSNLHMLHKPKHSCNIAKAFSTINTTFLFCFTITILVFKVKNYFLFITNIPYIRNNVHYLKKNGFFIN